MALKNSRILGIASAVYFALVSMSAFATVVENFTAVVVGVDPYWGIGDNYFGTFSYDETVLSGVGSETLDPVSGGVTIDFTFEGQAFDETNDGFFDASPVLHFLNGAPVYITYQLWDGQNGVDLLDQGIVAILIEGDLFPAVGGGFTVDTFVFPVPVPAAVWLFGSGLIGLIGVARRKHND